MGKIMKAGKVVLVLGGRYAGRKAVVIKVRDFFIKQNKFFDQNTRIKKKLIYFPFMLIHEYRPTTKVRPTDHTPIAW
jgi:hypothetical protein